LSDPTSATRKPSPATRLGWAALTGFSIWVLVILLLFGSPFPTSVITRWGQDIILAAFAVPGWLLAIARPRRIPLPLLVALALPLAVNVISSTISPYPSISWPATLRLLSGEGCFLLFYALASHRTGRSNLIGVIGVLAVIAVVAYLVMVLSMWRDWLTLGMPIEWLPLRPANRGGILPIPTWLGDMVLLTTPPTAYLAWRRGGSWRALGLGLVVAAMIALLITGTRSLWLFAGLVWIVGALVMSRRRAITVGVVIVVAVALFAASRTTVLSQSSRSLDEGRLSAYSSAVNQFVSSPVLGVGQGLYPIRRLAEPIDPLAYLAFPSAHNIVLNTAAETGLVGLLALAASAALAGVVLLRRLGLGGDEARLALVLSLSLLPVLLHALVDVVFELPGLLVVGTAIGALALAPSSTNSTTDTARPTGKARVNAALVIALGLAGLLIVARTLPVESSVADLLGADDPARSSETRIALAASATGRTPDLSPAWTSLAVGNDSADRGGDALAAAKTAASLDPLAQHEMGVAWIGAQSGDSGGAIAAMRSAVTRGRLDPVVQLNSAVFFAEHDLPEEARRALAQMLLDDPMLTLVTGGLPPVVQEMLPDARRSAVGQLSASPTPSRSALLIALLAEDPALAEGVARRFEAVGDPSGRLLHMAWGGDHAAVAALDAAARQAPYRQDLVFDRWLLATRECNARDQASWATVFRLGFGQSPVVPTALGQAPDIAESSWPLTYPGAVWGFLLPERPYPQGTWNYRIGVPDCAR
jgi:O-antigen ligase